MSQRHKNVGNYAVFNDKLGKGSFATVYKGKHIYTGVDVAVKVVDKKRLAPDKVRYVHEEVRLLRSLKHPNLVEMYESLDNDRHILLIMEFCGGGDLQKLIASRRVPRESRALTEEEAKHLFTQLIRGVEFLATQHKMHRDLKSANLLLTSPDALTAGLKIADFGLAKDTGTAVLDQPGAAMAMSDTICGTPLYMAPERTKQGYGLASDIFSCGVILYEMLIGTVPFHGQSVSEIQDKIRQGFKAALPPNAQLSWAVFNLLDIMLSPDATKRPTAAEIMNHPWILNVGGAPKTPTIPPASHVDPFAPVPPPPAPPAAATSTPGPTTTPPTVVEETSSSTAFRTADSIPPPESPKRTPPRTKRTSLDQLMTYVETVHAMARDSHTSDEDAAVLFSYLPELGFVASNIWKEVFTSEDPLRQRFHSKFMELSSKINEGYTKRRSRLTMSKVKLQLPQQIILTHAVKLSLEGATEESLGNIWSRDASAGTAHNIYTKACVLLQGLMEWGSLADSNGDVAKVKHLLKNLEKRCKATKLG